MRGPLSKYAWVQAITAYLELYTRRRLPNLKKIWDDSYFNWLKVQRIARDQIYESLFGPHGSRPGKLEDLCPACFYRQPDDKGPVYLAIDGNFQHKRFAHVSRNQPVDDWGQVFVPTPDKLSAPWMEACRDTRKDDDCRGEIDEDPGCHHRHAAAVSSGRPKPKSMIKFDETGLMGIDCKHDVGIRYLNLYGGEDRGSTLHLFRSTARDLAPGTPIFLFYDIACKFAGYLKRVDPDLAIQTTPRLNGFHVFCHDLLCQLKWGPKQTEGLGTCDGEACERDWSSMRYLISPSRISSAQRRISLLNERSIDDARVKRQLLCTKLKLGLREVRGKISKANSDIDRLHAAQPSFGSYSPIEYRDFLRDEFKRYKEALISAKDPAAMPPLDREIFPPLGVGGAVRTRDDDDSPSRLYMRRTNPADLPWAQIDQETRDILRSCGATPEDWEDIRERNIAEQKWQRLDVIQAELDVNISSKMLELRESKRVSGHKAAAKFKRAFKSR